VKCKLDVVPIPLSVQTPKINLSGNEKDDASWPHWAKFSTSYSILGDRCEKDSIYDSTESLSKLKRPGDREFLFRESAKDAWIRFTPEVGLSSPESGSQRQSQYSRTNKACSPMRK